MEAEGGSVSKHKIAKPFNQTGEGSPDHIYSNPEYVELPDGVVTVRGAYDHLPPLTPMVHTVYT